jgi:hypothetical protein
MNDKDLRKLFAKTERAYEDCWTILVSLRESPSEELPRFQPLLADRLAELSVAYQAVHQRRDALIRRKREFASDWFRRRQSQLDAMRPRRPMHDHVEINPNRCHGKPVLRGTRAPV